MISTCIRVQSRQVAAFKYTQLYFKAQHRIAVGFQIHAEAGIEQQSNGKRFGDAQGSIV